ncbi:MAG TPA: hypothetical protein DEB30_02660 [Candidatus Peribacter riflensis]|uniref:DUF11 domain-containing protein n=1 Tax=Candidatus Peribacter riflensis TaxID=1735162 RepID=A0A0S1SRP6_9BACT|nr:MAG: hypothetical protein PeribacterA2_0544 [Candidatus Peribacter riflensis]OGJ77076.1 MAG: hypothetical protein A2398_03055 [Candidatus Peribacteria bacterium RIFOXYB1_FULL_57_12]OGJ79367.1 MAG: hypothetical protein A2412_05260 [Candidatus Peribacteria bacterium RIFOXYC1_FULL_58_8]ALM11024.1 MAG: hypothetical protein PeribacterB2_0543 [Candidatus Peribacter riflensis]ALM12127.1 MAG: hypothetical protein PeribacterC2_0543 [Candidatus Peribacter riflensis]
MQYPTRSTLVSALAACSFFLASPALAAGTVTIVQQSPIDVLGEYTLTLPNGTQTTIHEQERKEITSAAAGTYHLRIVPPADAKVTTTVTKNGIDQTATAEKDVSFTIVDTEQVLVTISYRYDGTVEVQSNPEGASFELLGPNDLRVTGTSPATYSGMAPGVYRVTFHRKEDCSLVSPIQRQLDANKTLTLIGAYTCGVVAPPAPPPVEPEEPVADTNEGRTLRIWVATHQAETLPGSTVRTTITVKNTGTRTVHNLVISAQIDPAMLQWSTPLPRFGTVSGDVAFWEVPQLYSGKTWSVTMPLVTNASVQQGEQSVVTARVAADDLADGSTDTLLAKTTVGVTGMPETGFRADVIFLILSTIFTAVCAKKTVQQHLAMERA